MTTEEKDEIYSQGHRMAWLQMLNECLRQLGYTDERVSEVAWISEREAAVNALRGVCRDFGDNDWPDDLHLADVINKHLGDRLYENYEIDGEDDDEE